MPTEIKRSVCPYDCPDTCGLIVEVENGKAVKVSGDPEHPFTRGTLCPKMNHYERTVHSPLRLTRPLLRTGPRGSGQFQPISWQEAIQRIAARWKEVISKYGAESILPYSYAGTMGLIQRNSGHPFFYRLGASRLDRTICAPAKEAGWKAVMGNTAAPHPDEVASSDLVILWGINAVATNIHFIHGIREAKKKGAAVWLIDTYETPTAAIADRTFIVHPGSDGALALGLMNLLVKENLLDHEFLRTSVQGFAELKKEILPNFALQRISSLTGLPGETLEFMASTFGKARAPFIRVGAGLSRYGNGAMNVRSIVCLAALVGAYRKKGGGAFVGTFTAGAFPMAEILREDFLAGETRIVNMNQLGYALNHLDKPPIQSLYVYHSNPASITPDQNAVIKGLAREDLFTVVHERFMTDTARYADIVLPSTSSLEHSDLYRAYGSYCIQWAKPAIPPIGQSKSNWEVFSLLAAAMGFLEPFFNQSAEDLIPHILSLPNNLRKGIDEEDFAAGKAVELIIPAEAKTQFKTPSGKIEILNPTEPHPLPCYLPPHGGKDSFRLMTAPSIFALNSSFREREDLRQKEKAMFLKMNPADAQTKGLKDGEGVVAFNELGEVSFILQVTSKIPSGIVVAEGVWWLEHCPGFRAVNALTSQRLTDRGAGSTLYDNTVDVRRET
ncbi:MAG: molybdopterin oxidoreductase family protein [Thermodesulfobacteriota bacterium]|nr:molybdopterin oxidoreductase family protein [Thermodesulfobacteriota bacterium]